MRKIVSFSGGFDSTLVLADLCREASKGEVIQAVSFLCNITGSGKNHREHESQILIINELRKLYPDIVIKHETISISTCYSVGDAYNNKGLAQPILWMCNLIPLLKDEDEVYFGYIHGDDFYHFQQHAIDLFNAGCALQDNKDIKLMLPLRFTPKNEVLRILSKNYPSLFDYCISCESESYSGNKVCGNCTPCRHLKEGLLAMMLDDFVQDFASKKLKELFDLNVSVTEGEKDYISEDCVEECPSEDKDSLTVMYDEMHDTTE
jgi:7-cyano-7-deazaguanine synthase in queuosine biosynthesis